MSGPLGTNPLRIPVDAWRGLSKRMQDRRTKVASQSWPEFFLGLAIEIAVIAALVGALGAYVWWINH